MCFRRDASGSRDSLPPREGDRAERNAGHQDAAASTGGYSPLAVAGGSSSCRLLAVVKRCFFHHKPRSGRRLKQDDDYFDNTDGDTADLEAEGSKTQGALGGAVQVSEVVWC